MKILTDLHTHTNRSSHAYSTIYENVMQAAKMGLELIAITDHAPSSRGDIREHNNVERPDYSAG